MRYEIDLRREETKSVVIHGDGHREAVSKIRPGIYLAGWSIEAITPFDVDGEPGEPLYVAGACEACNLILFDGDDYATCEDGCQFCRPCAEQAIKAGEGTT